MTPSRPSSPSPLNPPNPHHHHVVHHHHHHPRPTLPSLRDAIDIRSYALAFPGRVDPLPGPRDAHVHPDPDRAKRPRKKDPPDICHVCGATDTPEWRKGPSGLRTLCNACGLNWSKCPSAAAEVRTIEDVLDRLRLIGRTRFRSPTHTLPPGARERALSTWLPLQSPQNPVHSPSPHHHTHSHTYAYPPYPTTNIQQQYTTTNSSSNYRVYPENEYYSSDSRRRHSQPPVDLQRHPYPSPSSQDSSSRSSRDVDAAIGLEALSRGRSSYPDFPPPSQDPYPHYNSNNPNNPEDVHDLPIRAHTHPSYNNPNSRYSLAAINSVRKSASPMDAESKRLSQISLDESREQQHHHPHHHQQPQQSRISIASLTHPTNVDVTRRSGAGSGAAPPSQSPSMQQKRSSFTGGRMKDVIFS